MTFIVAASAGRGQKFDVIFKKRLDLLPVMVSTLIVRSKGKIAAILNFT